ncbi:uncharacterized protein LOC119662328 [Teleopsis dalmanni]|uniref:uncharacterized protein LOC119662328 n=1 Tax=Teleopsis dalmanni TaxID=139649 RepID=UPI0018CD2582|nr:uncharacterized protein LOC119662328 [Teleopsis dalmanni]XP_037927857.1 uncharacterized protein LOC119662328 [Teleopsis dalmanni]
MENQNSKFLTEPMDANNSHEFGTENQLSLEVNPFIGLFRRDVCVIKPSPSQNLETDLPSSKEFEEKLPNSNQSNSKQLQEIGSEDTDIEKNKCNENKEQYLDVSENTEQSIDDGLHDSGLLTGTVADMKNDKMSKNNEQSIQDDLHETTLIDGLHGNTTPDMKKKLNENKKQAIVDRFLNSGNGDHSALCKDQNSDISDVECDSHISPDTRKLECFESNQTLISVEGNNIKNKILAWEKLSKTGISKYSEMSEFSAFGESHSNPEIEKNCMKMKKSNVKKTIKQTSSISVDPESFIPDASEETKIRAGFAVRPVSPKIANLQATILQKLK